MRIDRIVDKSFSELSAEKYDLALFASGYEERCTHVARLLDRTQIGHAVVLGFRNMRDSAVRLASDEYYLGSWSTDQEIADSGDDTAVYPILQRYLSAHGQTARILVDYSSMSRLWYAGVLNWARYAADLQRLEIDFLYSLGQHQETVAPMVIQDILCIPGCEGGPAPLYRSVAVFGLGFDALASLCVYDRLEPDVVYSYVASPGAREDYSARVVRENGELIKASSSTFDLPLTSVEQTYRYLAEVIEPHRRDADITLVPMGPKPHVLASILLALRFDDVACLRVSRRDRPESIFATGPVVWSRVEFVREEGL